MQIENRLGFGPEDGKSVRRHRFFAAVNWDDVLQRRTKPPFKPVLRSEDDVSNFDEEFTRKPPFDSPLGSVSDSVSELFVGFSYGGSGDAVGDAAGYLPS